MNSAVTAIGFDADYTLWDSTEGVFVSIVEAMRRVAEGEGSDVAEKGIFRKLTRAEFDAFMANGRKMNVLIRERLETLNHENRGGIPDDRLDQLTAAIDTAYISSLVDVGCRSFTLYDGVSDMIKAISSAHGEQVVLFVLSNKPQAAVEEGIRLLGLADHFRFYIGRGKGPAKPDAAVYSETIVGYDARLEGAPLIYLGDMPSDLQWVHNVRDAIVSDTPRMPSSAQGIFTSWDSRGDIDKARDLADFVAATPQEVPEMVRLALATTSSTS